MSSVYLTKAPAHALLAEARKVAKRAEFLNLNSPTFRHRAVMGLFPTIQSERPRTEGGILFRLETPVGQAPYFLIQSQIQPNAGLHAEILTKQVELPRLAPGTPVTFRTTLNAVRRETQVNARGKRGCKVRPVPEDFSDGTTRSMTEWLSVKLAPSLTDIEIVNHRRQVLSDPKGKGQLTLQLDALEGIAIVGHSETLPELLLNGVGREKAYGCGLLSIRGIG